MGQESPGPRYRRVEEALGQGTPWEGQQSATQRKRWLNRGHVASGPALAIIQECANRYL